MRINSNIARTLALVLAGACATGAAFADKGGHGHGHGHGHDKGQGDPTRVLGYGYGDGPGAGCPPGLAKKNNGCLPPGQAKKLARGDRIGGDIVYSPVSGPLLGRLPPLQRGYRYVRVGNDVVLLRPGGIVANIFANLG
jgi:hypothetical protein